MPWCAKLNYGKIIMRYKALDSWRGLCACLVVLFHVSAYSHFYQPLRCAYLAVDFFFILSGFVITASYEKRLLEGFSFRTFMFLRLARLYPLHGFILMCMLAAYAAKEMVLHNAAIPDPAFSFKAFLGNVFLLQGFGASGHTSWNIPSWSISVEFFTYILFGATLLVLRKSIGWAALAVVIASPILLYILAPKHTMDVTVGWGLLRGLYGFSLGSLCYKWHLHITKTASSQDARLFSLLEIATVMAAVLFSTMTAQQPLSILAPFCFAPVILIFALEKGILTRLLLHKAFIRLGELSYSIYMVHWLILYLFMNISGLITKHMHIAFSTIVTVDGEARQLMATKMWEGDLILPVILATTIFVSVATYRYIEDRANRWAKETVQKGGFRATLKPWFKPGRWPLDGRETGAILQNAFPE
jgi:peptidoglycan/LPS O-acetylase OafA/YrhL